MAQAGAPLSAGQLGGGHSLPLRCLYLFFCATPGCGGKEGSWAVLRAQMPGRPVEPEAPAAADAPTPEPKFQASQLGGGWDTAGDDWGAEGGGWGGGSGMEDLTAQLESALGAMSVAEPRPRAPRDAPGAPEGGGGPGAAAAVPEVRAGEPSGVPPYYLVAVSEPAGDDGDGAGRARVEGGRRAGRRAAGAEPPLPDHWRAAMEGLGDEDVPDGEGAGGGASQAPVPGVARAGWAGEQYEPDSAAGADSNYLKYSRRVARVPGQCARYGFGMRPIWPKPEAAIGAGPGPCGRCGAARVWELQVRRPAGTPGPGVRARGPLASRSRPGDPVPWVGPRA